MSALSRTPAPCATDPDRIERVLVARINRKLAKEGQALRTARGEKQTLAFGTHYVVEGNLVVATHCDVETIAAELGCGGAA